MLDVDGEEDRFTLLKGHMECRYTEVEGQKMHLPHVSESITQIVEWAYPEEKFDLLKHNLLTRCSIAGYKLRTMVLVNTDNGVHDLHYRLQHAGFHSCAIIGDCSDREGAALLSSLTGTRTNHLSWCLLWHLEALYQWCSMSSFMMYPPTYTDMQTMPTVLVRRLTVTVILQHLSLVQRIKGWQMTWLVCCDVPSNGYHRGL